MFKSAYFKKTCRQIHNCYIKWIFTACTKNWMTSNKSYSNRLWTCARMRLWENFMESGGQKSWMIFIWGHYFYKLGYKFLGYDIYQKLQSSCLMFILANKQGTDQFTWCRCIWWTVFIGCEVSTHRLNTLSANQETQPNFDIGYCKINSSTVLL